MKNSYTVQQLDAEKAMYIALVDMTVKMYECERKARAVQTESGEEKTPGELDSPGPLNLDAMGNPVQDANYWATIRKSLEKTLKTWTDAYISMFPDNKERNNGLSIMHLLHDSACKVLNESARTSADA